MHEFSARCDHIRVKLEAAFILCLIEDDLVFPACLNGCFVDPLFFSIFCGSKASGSLLVHFCARCDSINCKVKHFLWLDDAYKFICVLEYVLINLLLA